MLLLKFLQCDKILILQDEETWICQELFSNIYQKSFNFKNMWWGHLMILPYTRPSRPFNKAGFCNESSLKANCAKFSPNQTIGSDLKKNSLPPSIFDSIFTKIKSLLHIWNIYKHFSTRINFLRLFVLKLTWVYKYRLRV